MEQVQIIIVGAGMAGLCAAVEAASAGARVVVLEKEAHIGGSSLLSGCFMAFAGTPFQQERGIDDHVEALLHDLRTVGQYRNKAHLVEAYGKHQLSTYEWLVAQGVLFKDCQAVSGHSNPRGHTIVPAQAIEQLAQNAIDAGAVIKTNARVTSLIVEQHAVKGVSYEQHGNTETIAASHGVILTAGGFSQSEELLAQFAPQLAHTIRLGGRGNSGDGIKLAAAVGAWLEDTAYLKGTYGFHPTTTNAHKRQAHAFYKGGIIVNEQAERFINESYSYKLLGDAALQQSNQRTFQVWDATVMAQSITGDALYDFELLYNEGLIVKANTLQALAQQIGLQGDALEKTVEAYNEGIATNNDAWNRTTLTHTFGQPFALTTAPFYAMETATAMLATYAGVRVDEHAHVLNPFHKKIPHLFAAGEMVGGFHGAGYMTGSSLGKAAIFGRVAAKSALKSTNMEMVK